MEDNNNNNYLMSTHCKTTYLNKIKDFRAKKEETKKTETLISKPPQSLHFLKKSRCDTSF